MIHRSKLIAAMVGMIVAVVAMAPSYSSASDSSTTAPQQLSNEAFHSTLSQIQTIGTKFGEFKRVGNPISLPTSKIANGTDKINDQTIEVMTDYGVFIKK